jgi:hypothetical protein
MRLPYMAQSALKVGAGWMRTIKIRNLIDIGMG